uniref:hypothetical protein n=1 Tax=Streptomyces sp. CA-136453 TaxID=3240050 RepID=UPI003F494F89
MEGTSMRTLPLDDGLNDCTRPSRPRGGDTPLPHGVPVSLTVRPVLDVTGPDGRTTVLDLCPVRYR